MMSSAIFNAEKMYTYIRGFAAALELQQTLRALAFAREKHKGQFRKGGDPYIIHPLTMACSALSLGIRDDNVVATILLHDVCEDCATPPEELPVNDRVKRGVELMTFSIMDGETKESAKVRYYNMLPSCKEAAYTKLIDRCHNVSTMAGAFSKEKLIAYIDETRRFVIPMIRKIKEKYPDDTDALFVLKYHIVSVVDAIDCTIRTCEGEM